ncbi:MAG: acyl-CoA dehydrogenase family protein [Chloroflexi bacterium]|nr:acyl-CoA dehydrogenase family protein [Chloroflexota bacterium]MBV9597842.1 acyl-CoA dehydrogenase family protein [Chloroflexota bacterium]
MTTTLERVRELTPMIRQRSTEIEQGRHVPLDLIAELKAAGCFRMHVPAEYGGDDLTLSQALDVIEELARADGSTGWTTMIGSDGPTLFSRLPKTTFDTIYADGPDVIGAGALAPKGRAMRVDGGYCVSGQWSFASGCQHADWLLAHAVVVDQGQPQLLSSGVPDMRVAVFPTNQVEIVDTWHVVGLNGTGSHDFSLREAFCPEERTFSLMGPPSVANTGFGIPLLGQLSLNLAAVALGIGRGALDDIAQLAGGGKRRVFASHRLAESAVFQDKLGEADVTLRGAHALLHADAEAAWAKAGRGEEFSPLERLRIRATAAYVVRLMTRVVDVSYTAGGGSAIYEASPLQRRLRDIHALTQHIGVSGEAFEYVGALLAGEELDPRARV